MAKKYLREEYYINWLKKQVFQAARDGKVDKIVTLLLDQDKDIVDKDVLNYHTKTNGESTTPLIIAAKNGQEEVVHALLNIFCVDTEHTGTVIFAKEAIIGATALWCGSSAGYFNIVALLVESGAQINHATDNNSTPLQPACLNGRLDIVEYLVDHGADIDLPNKRKSTCLMTACCQKHTNIVDFLVSKGANLNCTDEWGSTTLHVAAKSGDVEIVKLLLKNRAVSKHNDYKLSPLTTAAIHGETDVVEYLICMPDCVRRDKIDALELLATAYAGSLEIQESYNCLMRAMEERLRDNDDIIEKTTRQPVPAFDNWIERKTVSQLEAIKSDPNAIVLECLAIQERLLVHTHPIVSAFIIHAGAVFAGERKYDRYIKLWKHALEPTMNTESCIYFPSMFMYVNGKDVNFKTTLEIFEHIVSQIKENMTSAFGDQDDADSSRKNTETKIIACVYLVAIMLKIHKNDTELEKIHGVVCKLVSLNPTLRNGFTPLHMCCDRQTYVEYDYILQDYILQEYILQDMVKFPNLQLCQIFLKCGAKVDSLDKNNNSPLRLIIDSSDKGTDFRTIHDIIKCLCENGAHADIYDIDNKPTLTYSNKFYLKNLLRSHSKISLSCIAARAIKKYKITYRNNIPTSLQNFIDLH